MKLAANRLYTRKRGVVNTYSVNKTLKTSAKVKNQQIRRYNNNWNVIVLGSSRKKTSTLKPRNRTQVGRKTLPGTKYNALAGGPRRRISSKARLRVMIRRKSRVKPRKKYRIKHRLAAYKRAKSRWLSINNLPRAFRRSRTRGFDARPVSHEALLLLKITKPLKASRELNARLWSKLNSRLDSRLRHFNNKMRTHEGSNYFKKFHFFKPASSFLKRSIKFRRRRKLARAAYVAGNTAPKRRPTMLSSRVRKLETLPSATQLSQMRGVNVFDRKPRRSSRKTNIKRHKTLTTSYARMYRDTSKVLLFKSSKLLKRSRLTSRVIKKSFRKRKVSSKNVNTTRSYNLLYSEQFSLKFTENSFDADHDAIVYPQSLYSLRVHNKQNPFIVDILNPAVSLSLMSGWGDYFAYSRNYQTFVRTQSTTLQVAYKATLSNSVYVAQVYNLFSNKKLVCIPRNNTGTYNNTLNTPSVNVKHSSAEQRHTQASARGYLASSLAHAWSLEMGFIKRKHLNSPNAVFILAKAPTYRMHVHSSWPISTSQHYGNFFNNEIHYSKSSESVNKASALFTKVQINPIAENLSGFNKSGLSLHIVDKLITRVRACARKNMREEYQKLFYTNPILNFTFNNKGKPLKSSMTLARIFNMRQITITKRRSTRRARRGRSRSLRKQKFITKQNVVFRKTRRKAYRVLRRTLRRVSKFARWRTRKATSFFTRFLRVNKQRKVVVKSFSYSNPTHTRQSKYSGFATKLAKHAHQTLSTTMLSSPTSSNGTLCSINLIGSNSLSLLTNAQLAWFTLANPLALKALMFSMSNFTSHKTVATALSTRLDGLLGDDNSIYNTNLIPHGSFQKHFSKKVLNSFANQRLREDLIPLYQNTLIRFIEFCTGKKAMFQFYPFVNQHVDKEYMVRYKKWLPRMSFYERRLGHRFFLEESLHIMHLSFSLRDPKIIASWLRAIILRISFWKTRSIFRFLKYLFHNYFIHVFDDIRIKGLKIRLKGKISAAGNSRKRTILYRVGKTSHSEVNLRVVKDFSLINTFTGVMGFQVYLFY